MKNYRIAIYIRLSMEDLDVRSLAEKEESCRARRKGRREAA